MRFPGPRWPILGLVLSLLVACGNGSEVAPPTSEDPVSPTDPVAVPPEEPSTTAGQTTTTTTVPSTTAPTDPAPDFTLELGNGGTFLLSQEARPVFMVFWAEW